MIRRIVKHSGIICLIAGGAGFFFLLALLYVLPCFEPDPMEKLNRQTPARCWYDEQGRLLYVRRNWDAQWRFDLELEDMSPDVIRTMLAVEDRNFRRHNGVDMAAAFRAVRQNILYGRIISGASTITMQLAGMCQTGRRRSLGRKLRQIVMARRLEQLYSKDRILKEYMNRLPFGGKIYGIEAAAQYYFGQHAKALNRSESALLCGLPQRPNAYRPDRFLNEALKRRDRILFQLEHLGKITAEERQEIRHREPLRFRDYGFPAEFQRCTHSPDWMYFNLAAREAGPECYRIRCPYHAEISRVLRNVLTEQCRNLPGVRDAAGVVLENATGRILALTGTITPPDSRGGQVNAATAIRSAGSSLKPFLYAEAVSGGMLTADTILKDLPVRYGTYAPGNYDGTFRGEVSAQDALADSLNTPAVRLAEDLGTERILEMFRKMNLISSGHRRIDGLSIALGTAGHTLLGLTAAYRVFPGNGKWIRPSFLSIPVDRPEIAVYTEGTGDMIRRMLTRPLPDFSGGSHLAWKTGTSNGNHDAWCFAFSANYTVGVWFGNKDGKASATLVGQSAAAPAAGRVMEEIGRFADHGILPDFPDTFRIDRLCSSSGLRANADCRSAFPGYSLKHSPLRPCRRCGGKQISKVMILNPKPENYLVQENGKISLFLTAAGTTPLHWFLNRKYLGRFQQKAIPFTPGVFHLKAISEDPDTASGTVTFHVSEMPMLR